MLNANRKMKKKIMDEMKKEEEERKLLKERIIKAN